MYISFLLILVFYISNFSHNWLSFIYLFSFSNLVLFYVLIMQCHVDIHEEKELKCSKIEKYKIKSEIWKHSGPKSKIIEHEIYSFFLINSFIYLDKFILQLIFSYKFIMNFKYLNSYFLNHCSIFHIYLIIK